MFKNEPIENIQNVKVVVDLGANIGLFAIYNNSYHKNAKLICIEPEAQNYKLLKKNIKMNNIKAITLQKAITDKQSNKLIKIYKSKSSTGYSINSNYSDEEEFFEAIGITLEKVCVENNIRSIDILKCDIEGAEKNIFINILGEFKNKIKYIILEYHSEEIRKIVIRSLKSDFNLTSHRKFGLNDIGLLTFRNKTKA